MFLDICIHIGEHYTPTIWETLAKKKPKQQQQKLLNLSYLHLAQLSLYVLKSNK